MTLPSAPGFYPAVPVLVERPGRPPLRTRLLAAMTSPQGPVITVEGAEHILLAVERAAVRRLVDGKPAEYLFGTEKYAKR